VGHAIVAPFLRYGDLLTKNYLFFLTTLIRRPRSLFSLWNFAVYLQSFWHSTSVWRSDGQTDGQTSLVQRSA